MSFSFPLLAKETCKLLSASLSGRIFLPLKFLPLKLASFVYYAHLSPLLSLCLSHSSLSLSLSLISLFLSLFSLTPMGENFLECVRKISSFSLLLVYLSSQVPLSHFSLLSLLLPLLASSTSLPSLSPTQGEGTLICCASLAPFLSLSLFFSHALISEREKRERGERRKLFKSSLLKV